MDLADHLGVPLQICDIIDSLTGSVTPSAQKEHRLRGDDERRHNGAREPRHADFTVAYPGYVICERENRAK